MNRLVLLAVLFWPVGAAADNKRQTLTGNELQSSCASSNPSSPITACVTYIAAYLNSAPMLIALGVTDEDGTEFDLCVPEGFFSESASYVKKQLRQVWLNFAKGHPEKLPLPANFLVLKAFSEAWPCKS